MSTPTPPTAPPDIRWPIRPRLTMLLAAAMLVAVGVLTVVYRGESTAGTAIARLLGIPPWTPAATESLTLRVERAEQPGAEWIVTTENPEDEPKPRTPGATGPAVRLALTASPPERTGLWAPTNIARGIGVTPSQVEGRPFPTGDDALAALSAVHEDLTTRREWRSSASVFLAATLQESPFTLQFESRLRKGYLHNALVIGVALALAASLSRRPTGLHQMYDSAMAQGERFGAAAVLGLVWTASPAILGIALLYFLGDVADFLRLSPTLGWFGYVAVFVVSAGIGFLPTYGQSFLGGWVFGFALGFPGAMLGFVGGSIIGYLIAQRVSKDRVTAALDENPKSAKVRRALVGRGFWRTTGIVTLVRIPPNSPFALTNMLLASSGVGMGPYILGTAIGMAPRTAIAVWLAARGAATGARDIQDFIENQPWWALPAGLGVFVVVLAIIGWIGNRALHEATRDA